MKKDLFIFFSLSLIMAAMFFFTSEETFAVGSLIAYNVTPLMRVPGSVSMPGYKNHVAIIPLHYIKTMPTAKYDDEGRLISTVLEGEWTFEDNKNFKYIGCTNSSVGHDFETQGVTGSKSFKQKPVFEHPGIHKEEALDFVTEIINCECVMVIENKNGRQLLIGQPGDGFEPTVTGSGGKVATDGKAFSFAGEWDASAPVFYLKENIDFEALKKLIPQENE